MSAVLVKLADDLASCVETKKTDHPDASIWTKVDTIARQLANGLRTRGETGSWIYEAVSMSFKINPCLWQRITTE